MVLAEMGSSKCLLVLILFKLLGVETGTQMT